MAVINKKSSTMWFAFNVMDVVFLFVSVCVFMSVCVLSNLGEGSGVGTSRIKQGNLDCKEQNGVVLSVRLATKLWLCFFSSNRRGSFCVTITPFYSLNFFLDFTASHQFPILSLSQTTSSSSHLLHIFTTDVEL